MDLENRLNRALEELWQAALTVSSLKYVAGLVSQDIGMISNSLDKEEEKHDLIILDDSEESNIDQPEAAVAENDDHHEEEEEERSTMPSSVCHSVTSPASPDQWGDTSLVSQVSHSPGRGWQEQHDFSSLHSHQAPVQFLEPQLPQQELSLADLGEECPHTEIFDQEFDLNNQTSDSIKESKIFFVLYNQPSKPLENDFSISMVSHQITSPDLPEDYHHQIVSSVSHQQHQLEEDFTEPQTSLMTHYNNIYYEALEEVREITIVEEEDETYTDIDALETIQEVSEVCDLSEQTDITETEFIEEIDNYPTFHLNDDDILDTISKDLDIDDPTEIISDLAEENPQYEEITEVAPDITTEEYRIEEPDDFSISMVSHQTISPDLPEDYHHQIVSSVSHQQHHLEEDFTVTQTTLISHYNNIYYETLVEMREIPIVEDEVTEDYTDIDALETIQEVSEVYDTSEQTDITETEFIDEEIGDFPTFNLNDVDILYSISKDKEETTETINDLIKECPGKSEILEEEIDLSKETSENSTILEDSNIQICFVLYNQPSKPLENDFSISMASHQTISPDLPEDYHHYHHQIVSSVSHQQHHLEEDFTEPQTSLMSHYNNIYYEALEEVREITIVEDEVTEDYTDIEALETIQEVSEVYDTSEQTDITETEFIEDIDDFPTFNLNDVDILDVISKDIHEPTIDKTKNPVEPNKDVIDEEPVVAEDERFELIPSLHCHFLTSLDYEAERLPSCVSHQVSNENTEQGDFLSQMSHQANTLPQHVFYLKNYPQVGLEYHEEESASKLKVKRENKNFARGKIEVEQMYLARTECQETGDLADINNDEQTVKEEVTETRAPNIEEDQAGLIEDVSEGTNTPREIEYSSKLPHDEEISCIESKSASEYSEKEDENITDPSSVSITEKEGANQSDQSSATENSEMEGSTQSYKLQLTRIKELQKLVEDELEEFDTKRKVIKSNIVQATETQIVNIVKGIEFRSEIKITQLTEEDEDLDKTEDDADPITEIDDTNNNEILDEEDVIEEELLDISDSGKDLPDEEENLIHASCTLKKDNTVSISSNVITGSQTQLGPEDPNISAEETDPDRSEGEDVKTDLELELDSEECPTDEDKRENDLKLQPRAPPRKSVSLETKIRDRELLDSLLSNQRQTESIPEEEKNEMIPKPSILKPNKSSITLSASLNENVKKQSYRIKFRIKLNDKSPKESSVLRYLFGCFGGERLFHANQ